MEYETSDYTGVPLFQLRAIIENHLRGRSKYWLAEQTQISQKELARILVKARPTAVLGLGKCDKILLALGLNVTDLERYGDLNVVPLGAHKKNAFKMACDILEIREEPSEFSAPHIAAQLLRDKQEILAKAA